MRPEFIPVGQIVNAHGIRGEVKLNPAGFDPAFLAAFDTLYIGGKETKVIRHVWNVLPFRLITRWPIQRKPVLPLPDVSAYPATGWRTAMNWRYRVMWTGGVPVR